MVYQAATADVKPDIVDQPELSFERRRRGERFDVLDVRVATRIETCGLPNCCKEFVRFGARDARYSDEPLRGQPIYLQTSLQRYECKTRGHTFTYPVYALHQKCRMTGCSTRAALQECVIGTFDGAGRSGHGARSPVPARHFEQFINLGPLFQHAVRPTTKFGKPNPAIALLVVSAPYMLAVA